MQSENDLAVVEAFVVQQVRTMNALQQDRVIILQQPVQQVPVRSRANDVRQLMGKPLMSFMAGVIVNLDAIVVQYGLAAPSILETVQMDTNPGCMKRSDLMKQIKDTPVIHRVGYIQTYNMKVFVFHVVIN
jgi:hypothetical protein